MKRKRKLQTKDCFLWRVADIFNNQIMKSYKKVFHYFGSVFLFRNVFCFWKHWIFLLQLSQHLNVFFVALVTSRWKFFTLKCDCFNMFRQIRVIMQNICKQAPLSETRRHSLDMFCFHGHIVHTFEHKIRECWYV